MNSILSSTFLTEENFHFFLCFDENWMLCLQFTCMMFDRFFCLCKFHILHLLLYLDSSGVSCKRTHSYRDKPLALNFDATKAVSIMVRGQGRAGDCPRVTAGQNRPHLGLCPGLNVRP